MRHLLLSLICLILLGCNSAPKEDKPLFEDAPANTAHKLRTDTLLDSYLLEIGICDSRYVPVYDDSPADRNIFSNRMFCKQTAKDSFYKKQNEKH